MKPPMDITKLNIKRILRENTLFEDEFNSNQPSQQPQQSQPVPEDEKGEEKKATDGEYERVRGILSNDLINHAGVVNLLWGKKEATQRSLFRKKLAKELNDNGTPYEFTKEEMTKVISILDNLTQQMSGALRAKT